jgi:D-sedoheptulose 7-phosphate isomerase
MTELFPTVIAQSCAGYAVDYFSRLAEAAKGLDLSKLSTIAAKIKETIDAGHLIFICGNGGSAGIANHSLCDFLKCVRSDTGLMPRFFSLAAHTELNSALANDISYDEIFAYQLASMGRPGDLLWTISSSGNSPNVVRAIEVAREKGITSISFTGFGGGRSRETADLNAHVDAQNYGIVEDIHMSFIHIITQYLRMTHMDPALVGNVKF